MEISHQFAYWGLVQIEVKKDHLISFVKQVPPVVGKKEAKKKCASKHRA